MKRKIITTLSIFGILIVTAVFIFLNLSDRTVYSATNTEAARFTENSAFDVSDYAKMSDDVVANLSVNPTHESVTSEKLFIGESNNADITFDDNIRNVPEFQALVNEEPLFINYSYVIEDYVSDKLVYDYSDEGGFELVIIYYPGVLKDFTIYDVSYDSENHFFYITEMLFTMTELNSNEVIAYNTVIPSGIPNKAISFKDANDIVYSFALGADGQTGGIYASKVDLR